VSPKGRGYEPPSGEKFAREAKEAAARKAAMKGRPPGKTPPPPKKAPDPKVTPPRKPKKRVVSKPKRDKSIRRITRVRERNNPPAPSKVAVKTEPSKTYSVVNLSGFQNQEQELLNAYVAMAGSELFQYTNSQTVDGAYSDVAIINVLSRRRQQYTPNRLIDLAQVYVKAMWIENGNLCVEVDDPDGKWDQCLLSLLVGTSSSIITKTVN
jgi:hypothetical protein